MQPNEEPDHAPARDLADPTFARRSLRASLERRLRRARRQRATSAGRRTMIVALSVLVLGAAGATAHDRGAKARSADRAAAPKTGGYDVRALQRKLGVTADGIVGPQTRRAIKRFQRRNGLVADGIVGPRTLAALGLSRRANKVSAAKAAPAGETELSESELETMRADLERIARCESGGNPKAVSPDGRYRGKYQFALETWESVGGEGDPIDASEAEQDLRAAVLMQRQGPSAWPACSGQRAEG